MDFSEVLNQLDYRRFLAELIATRPGKGRGLRSRLASFIGCQTTYVSHVLAERGHFSLEQAEAAARFFAASARDKEVFLTLVQANRATTPQLRQVFDDRLQQWREAHLQVRNRIHAGAVLNDGDKSQYYSSWLYGAIHVLATVPRFNTAARLAARLGLAPERVAEVIAFLAEIGLMAVKGDEVTVLAERLNLPGHSPLVLQHHLNWHLRAMHAVERRDGRDLHYSGVATVSTRDVARLKELLLQAISGCAKTIEGSQADDGYGLTMSLFSL